MLENWKESILLIVIHNNVLIRLTFFDNFRPENDISISNLSTVNANTE